MKKIMIIHPEGNLNNNPNHTGIVEILCEQGYLVDIYSPRSPSFSQTAHSDESRFILMQSHITIPSPAQIKKTGISKP